MDIRIEDLIKDGESFANNKHLARDNKLYLKQNCQSTFFEWANSSLMFLQYEYPNHPQTESFKKIINDDQQMALFATYQNLLGILKAFAKIKPQNNNLDAELILTTIFNNFSRFVHQLKRGRHDGRDLFISDEYDVQDLLHAVLKLHFSDIRPEVWTPNYAGSSSRMDFLINDCKSAIEVKFAKHTHKENKIGEELLSDIAKYSEYPECQSLYCFIYDPDYCICNPKGLEDDLNKNSSEKLRVKVFVRPLE